MSGDVGAEVAAVEVIYRALNARLGEPDQGSGTNSRRWGLAYDVAEALASLIAERVEVPLVGQEVVVRHRTPGGRWVTIRGEFVGLYDPEEHGAAALDPEAGSDGRTSR